MRRDSYPEPRWQQLRHRHRERFSIPQKPHHRLRPRKLRDHLPARPARRKLMSQRDDRERAIFIPGPSSATAWKIVFRSAQIVSP
jgi:hypothetical protein